MAIKFICGCGKHLRAREEMAAKRSFCPRCGAPVGIPSLKPHHPGAPATPLSPADRLRTRRCVPPSPDAIQDLLGPDLTRRQAADSVQGAAEAEEAIRLRNPRPLETAAAAVPSPSPRRKALFPLWCQALIVPRRACLLLAVLALALAMVFALTALILPHTVELRQASLLVRCLVSSTMLVPVLLFAYVASCLDCMFASAAQADFREVRWPGGDIIMVLRSGMMWVAAFVAGPAIPAVAAAAYWLHFGALDWLDAVIVVELATIAVGYWLLTGMALAATGRIRDLAPRRIVEMVDGLGWRAGVATLAATSLVFGFAFAVVTGMEQMHGHAVSGCLILYSGCFAALVAAAILFRLLGYWWLDREPLPATAPPKDPRRSKHEPNRSTP